MVVARAPLIRFIVWRCPGRLRDGRPCRRMLAEVEYPPNGRVRRTCDRCHRMVVWPDDGNGASQCEERSSP